MKKLLLVMMPLALALAVTPLLAQERMGRGDGMRRGPASRLDGGPRIEKVIKDLKLEGDKEAQVKQILQTHKQAVENWQKENQPKMQELRKDMQAAREAKDQEKLKSLRADQQKLMESRTALQQDLFKQLGDVLDKEQMETVKAAMAPRGPAAEFGPMRGLRNLDLTKEQQEQAKKIMDDARDAARKATEPAQRMKIMQDALEKVKTDVLTEEQRKKFEATQARRGDMFRRIADLNLTDDQKKKIEDIRTETEAAVKDAKTPQDRREITRAAFKKVVDEVLTDEQREEMKKNRPARGPRDGRGGPRGDTQPAPAN